MTALYLAWAARYKVIDPEAFFIPFYVLGSVFIGVGVARILSRFRGRRWAPWVLLVLAITPVGAYVAMPDLARRVGFKFFSRELPYRDAYAYMLQPWKAGDLSAAVR